MEIVEEPMLGLKVLKARVFEDSRGYFYESYNQQAYNKIGIHAEFVQDNISKSQIGTLRGLHFQSNPMAQGKLVRVITGSVLDVAVDIRKNSKTYGQHFGIVLSDKNFISVYIPEGFAHGFAVLEENTVFSYKCTNFYSPANEGGILWNCPELNIAWNLENPIISPKDLLHPSFNKFNSPF